MKKIKGLIAACFLVLLSLAVTSNAQAVGAKGQFTCYNYYAIFPIETSANYCSQDQAAQALYRNALAFCSTRGGLSSYNVNYFFYYGY
ncbi:MAG: hypothetical protein D3908_04365 [Candidatus Electrothrix sp. AUS4]|nr:hypothetical protein [Candidatus Electrothrix sp. AUS4]